VAELDSAVSFIPLHTESTALVRLFRL